MDASPRSVDRDRIHDLGLPADGQRNGIVPERDLDDR
jgi:hypothetical protein